MVTAGEGVQISVVRGRVLGDGQPLPEVAVSDGYQIVHTDHSGRYELPIVDGSSRFVFIMRPRGYWSERFYVCLNNVGAQDAVDFPLSRCEQADRFDFGFVTDMHLERRDVGKTKLMATLAEIHQTVPRPAFLWFQGDICLQSNSGDVYAECLATLQIPAHTRRQSRNDSGG